VGVCVGVNVWGCVWGVWVVWVWVGGWGGGGGGGGGVIETRLTETLMGLAVVASKN